jgi:hypothetical protein
MLLLLGILNLGAITRILRLPKSQEPPMPNDPERTPADTAHMAREVMRRMLEKPPQTHQDMPKTRAKKSKSRKK